MIEERLDKLIEYLEELQPDTCPTLDVNANDVLFCNEEYCINYGGAECWKRWILGEKE